MLKYLVSAYFLLFLVQIQAQSNLPLPDHIVVLIYENKAYEQIIGSSSAPYINDLANDPNAALFIKSYGIEHPSQPNYLDLYSGCNQGVTDNNLPENQPFNTPNLGSQLITAGHSFITYSEDLPEVGFNGIESGNYARRHNPAANWMGEEENQIPVETNQPFSAFPSSDYNQLPDVCFVVPNVANDMHDGSISTGDAWYYNNLSDYVEWAKSNNSLFILTFDEDNYLNENHITTIITGPMVNGGIYSDSINHYNVLRTIEDIFDLPYACNAENALPVESCWMQTRTAKEENESMHIFPNPANHYIEINTHQDICQQELIINLYNQYGQKVMRQVFKPHLTLIPTEQLHSGLYFIQLIEGSEIIQEEKLIIQH